MNKLKVKIKKLTEDARIPLYQTSGSSGFDFHALESYRILPGETALIRTGLSFQIPEGYELQVRPRSGLSLKTKLRIANSPGTVDSDYSGEVCIIMENTHPYVDVSSVLNALIIGKGDRIAQGVIVPVYQATFEEVDELDKTERGAKGFGASGV